MSSKKQVVVKHLKDREMVVTDVYKMKITMADGKSREGYRLAGHQRGDKSKGASKFVSKDDAEKMAKRLGKPMKSQKKKSGAAKPRKVKSCESKAVKTARSCLRKRGELSKGTKVKVAIEVGGESKAVAKKSAPKKSAPKKSAPKKSAPKKSAPKKSAGAKKPGRPKMTEAQKAAAAKKRAAAKKSSAKK